jgi:hypothetical protein
VRLIRDLLVAALVAAAVFCILELALRLAGVKFEAQLFTSDGARGYAWRPRAEGWAVVEGENYVRINSDGLRDRERSLAKPPRTLRIAVIGSSEVAAQQVPLEKTFESVLEKHLNDALRPAGYQAEVINFGVDGYNQAQDYLTIRDQVWKYQPDIVMFAAMPAMLTRNTRELFPPMVSTTPFYDVENGEAVPDRLTRSFRAPSAAKLRLKDALASVVNRSQILLAIDDLRNGLPENIRKLRLDFHPVMAATKQPHSLSLLEQVHNPDNPKLRKSWEIADALLEKMNETCKQHGAEFWLTILSDPYTDNPNPESRRTEERRLGLPSLLLTDQRLADMASRRGIEVALLSPQLADYAAAHQVALHGFFNTGFNTGHFNALGNDVIGRMLAQVLLARSPVLRRREMAGVNAGAGETSSLK